LIGFATTGEKTLDSLIIAAIGDFAAAPVRGVDFVRLSGPDNALPQPPRFTFGSFPPYLMARYYGLANLGSVGVFSLKNFMLSGAFVLTTGNVFYRCPELNIHEKHIESELGRITVKPAMTDARKLPGTYVMLAGPGYGVYGIGCWSICQS
jgi:hypothetical protein